MRQRVEYAESEPDEEGDVTIEIALSTQDPALLKKARRLFEKLVREDEPNLSTVRQRD